VKTSPLGPAGLALAAVLLLCVIAPPEVRGIGLGAVALFVAVACAATSAIGAGSTASGLLVAGLPLVLFELRTSLAPGEAVEPAVTFLLAALAGIAAAASAVSPERLAALYCGLSVFSGGRAVYEAVWGLTAWARQLRAAVPEGTELALLNRLEQGRPYAGFPTPAALGCFLAMTLPAIGAWALGKQGRTRAFGMGTLAVAGVGLIATRSLTAMGALAAALALAALRGRISRRVLAVASVAIGLAVIVAGAVRPDSVFAPTRPDSPWRLRTGNVRIALEIVSDHPIVGAGPGGYAEAFPQYRRAGDNESRHAHNLPAELVAEWGIPAGVVLSGLFFWLFLSPLVTCVGDPRTFGSGLAVGAAAFAFHNLVDFTAFLPSLLLVAAVSRGLLVGPGPADRAGPRARAAWVALALSISVVAVACGLARESLFDARTAAAEGDHETAARLAARAERLAPWDADPPLIAAEAHMASGSEDPTIALADADRAVRRAPARSSARWARAQARTATADLPGAYADLAEASRLYPQRAEYAARRDVLADVIRKSSEAAPR